MALRGAPMWRWDFKQVEQNMSKNTRKTDINMLNSGPDTGGGSIDQGGMGKKIPVATATDADGKALAPKGGTVKR